MFNNQILASRPLETGAVCRQPDQPFTRTSGSRFPIYSDNRILLSSPESRTGLIDLMAKVVKDFEFFDTIEGVTTGIKQVIGVIAIFQYVLPVARVAFEKLRVLLKMFFGFQTIISVDIEQLMIEPRHIELLTDWSSNKQVWSDHYLVSNTIKK